MIGFFLSDRELVCDGVPLASLADAEGTPLYVYSAAVVRERYRALDEAFEGYPHAVHYALKANSSLALLQILQRLGSRADANSIWEIEVARRAGFAPSDIVFTGVGKSAEELARAVDLGVKAIIVESAGELDRIEALARQAGHAVRVAIRLNPDIDAGSHPHISTGLRTNKFGLSGEAADQVLATIAQRPLLALVAIHVHVGSQITSLDPLRSAAQVVARVATDLLAVGAALEYVDLGGGLGISYDGHPVVSAREYARVLVDAVRPTGLPIVVEPGRSIVGPAGALVARVVDVKPRTDASEFVVIDAGMSELLRPALYGAFHRIDPVRPRDAGLRQYEIVGPICESSDVVGRDRTLSPLEVGDLVAVLDAGAYGSAMASNYNRRPLPLEVLVEEGTWRVIRRRQQVDDLLALEQ